MRHNIQNKSGKGTKNNTGNCSEYKKLSKEKIQYLEKKNKKRKIKSNQKTMKNKFLQQQIEKKNRINQIYLVVFFG